MAVNTVETTSTTIRIGVREFNIPPVRDCLVVGKESPIGCVALKQALALLHGEPFEDLHPENGTISDILVRKSILRKIPSQKLMKLMAERVAPLMTKYEIVLVRIEAEVVVECQV